MSFRRKIALAALTGASLAGIGALAACVIADPPADLPIPPRRHPNIVHGATLPSDGRVLTTWPTQFIVPVEIVDPNTTFDWRVFIDFDPVANPSPALQPDIPESPTPDTLDGGVQLVDFSLLPPTDTTQCHVVEFIVALSFKGASPHTPDSYGADSIHWFYNPSGDVGACATYDAGGIDGAFPDSGGVIVPPADGGAD